MSILKKNARIEFGGRLVEKVLKLEKLGLSIKN